MPTHAGHLEMAEENAHAPGRGLGAVSAEAGPRSLKHRKARSSMASMMRGAEPAVAGRSSDRRAVVDDEVDT
jgi:hypothetical protein